MRSKLLALILIPTLVGVVLGGLRVATSVGSALEYQRASDVASLVTDLGALGHELAAERDLAARYVAAGRREQDLEPLRNQQELVDAAAKRVLDRSPSLSGALSELGQRQLARLVDRLRGLKDLRDTVESSQLPPLPTMEKYSLITADLLSIYDEVGQGTSDEQLISTSAALGAIARQKDEISQQRGLLAIGLIRGRFEGAEFEAFHAARSRRDSDREAFRLAATPEQRQVYDDVVSGQEIGLSELYVSRAIFLHNSRSSLRKLEVAAADDVDRWFKAVTTTADRVYDVEKRLAESITLRTADVRGAEQSAAVISAVLVMALLILVLLITTVVARSLVRPLRRLRSEALQIAGRRLPDTVQQLRDTGETTVRVEPIGVDSDDEIGEVARAFDEVHREAVRLAGEEARLRANVNAMFVNLSRRSQTLVERQITLIDSLEQGEQDEQRLGNLFKLDHLATRMRRNSENLLVLAGQEPPRRWSQPVKLIDVARASLSEVENYERVTLQLPEGVAVAGQAVNDVIHLLAELIENALSFSPRETRVTVSGSRIDTGGIMISITDNGIGMTQEELAAANERLEHSPTVDVSVSRRMGLFVVARLAHRHGIRVQLRPHGSGGLTAMVLLPETLLGTPAPATAGAPGLRADSFGPDSFGADSFGPDSFGPDSFGAGSFGTAAPAWQAPPMVPEQAPPGSWPSIPQTGWPSDPGPSWPSEPRIGETAGPWPSSAGETVERFDTADPWLASRGWNSSPPPAPDEAPAWSRGETGAGRSHDFPDPDAGRNYDFPDPGADKSYDFPETEAAATGPIPVVKPPSAGDEFLPIFASVESAWFEQGGSSTWGSSKADAGWSAAEAVREPVKDGSTAAGLPKRVPKANLVPGSADSATAPKGVTPTPAYSPERVRSRLSSFQQGFRAARADISEGRAYQSGPRHVDSREEGE
ncbi:nitrate- and nitrite sensing domain-containing protein [Thermoactinospora rubra]|uniref:sensor histidine kinase n=1 Tax=Thermoactinospora rubra TaxID=1088767 RepID=UPI0013020A3C|nr:nitrate- and nitrite sensing domain-containing protein [Thermoactinospora rubra]